MLCLSATSPFASFVLLALSAQTAWAGSGGNVLNELPQCWDTCSKQVSGSDCSWYETNCICSLANNSPYLANTISCAKQTCNNFSPSDSNRFLSPIEFSCSLTTSGGIEQNRLNAAQAAAQAPASSSSKPSPQTSSEPSTTQAPSTLETTLKATTTNSKGSTAVVDQPLQYGPSGVSSGKQSTSIIESTVNILPVPASGSSATTDSGATTTVGGIVMATGTPTPSSGLNTSATASSTSQAGGGGTLFDSQGSPATLVSVRSVTLVAVTGAVASFLFAVSL